MEILSESETTKKQTRRTRSNYEDDLSTSLKEFGGYMAKKQKLEEDRLAYDRQRLEEDRALRMTLISSLQGQQGHFPLPYPQQPYHPQQFLMAAQSQSSNWPGNATQAAVPDIAPYPNPQPPRETYLQGMAPDIQSIWK